jgi:hypothetical protein
MEDEAIYAAATEVVKHAKLQLDARMIRRDNACDRLAGAALLIAKMRNTSMVDEYHALCAQMQDSLDAAFDREQKEV